MLIEGFFTQVQHDAICLYDRFKNRHLKQEKEMEQKMMLAAARMFSTLGMAISVIVAVSGVPKFIASPIGTLLRVTICAAIYALFHDLFVVAKNMSASNSVFTGIAATSLSFLEDCQDFFIGKKDLDDAARNALTQGTLFRPIWDTVIARTGMGKATP